MQPKGVDGGTGLPVGPEPVSEELSVGAMVRVLV